MKKIWDFIELNLSLIRTVSNCSIFGETFKYGLQKIPSPSGGNTDNIKGELLK